MMEYKGHYSSLDFIDTQLSSWNYTWGAWPRGGETPVGYGGCVTDDGKIFAVLSYWEQSPHWSVLQQGGQITATLIEVLDWETRTVLDSIELRSIPRAYVTTGEGSSARSEWVNRAESAEALGSFFPLVGEPFAVSYHGNDAIIMTVSTPYDEVTKKNVYPVVADFYRASMSTGSLTLVHEHEHLTDLDSVFVRNGDTPPVVLANGDILFYGYRGAAIYSPTKKQVVSTFDPRVVWQEAFPAEASPPINKFMMRSATPGFVTAFAWEDDTGAHWLDAPVVDFDPYTLEVKSASAVEYATLAQRNESDDAWYGTALPGPNSTAESGYVVAFRETLAGDGTYYGSMIIADGTKRPFVSSSYLRRNAWAAMYFTESPVLRISPDKYILFYDTGHEYVPGEPQDADQPVTHIGWGSAHYLHSAFIAEIDVSNIQPSFNEVRLPGREFGSGHLNRWGGDALNYGHLFVWNHNSGKAAIFSTQFDYFGAWYWADTDEWMETPWPMDPYITPGGSRKPVGNSWTNDIWTFQTDSWPYSKLHVYDREEHWAKIGAASLEHGRMKVRTANGWDAERSALDEAGIPDQGALRMWTGEEWERQATHVQAEE